MPSRDGKFKSLQWGKRLCLNKTQQREDKSRRLPKRFFSHFLNQYKCKLQYNSNYGFFFVRVAFFPPRAFVLFLSFLVNFVFVFKPSWSWSVCLLISVRTWTLSFPSSHWFRSSISRRLWRGDYLPFWGSAVRTVPGLFLWRFIFTFWGMFVFFLVFFLFLFFFPIEITIII